MEVCLAAGGVLLLLFFSSSIQRASSHAICEFILRTDKARFRDIVTPNEWQKRQRVAVYGVKKKEQCSRFQKRLGPMLWGIKAVGGRDMILGGSSDRIGPGDGDGGQRAVVGWSLAACVGTTGGRKSGLPVGRKIGK
jgi:hypothetical protein